MVQSGVIHNEFFKSLSSCNNSVNCTSTRHVYIIDNNGDVLKCRKLSDTKIGNAFKDSFMRIVSNEANKRCEELVNESQCGKCKYFNVCAGCPAMAYVKKNNRFSKDPDCFLNIDGD